LIWQIGETIGAVIDPVNSHQSRQSDSKRELTLSTTCECQLLLAGVARQPLLGHPTWFSSFN